MAEYRITLTDTEVKSLRTVMFDIDDWMTNAITNRARIAKNDILQALIAHCNANDISIATGEAAQVQQAYDLGIAVELTDEEPSLPGE
mgnify:CR=1 FL=1